MRDDHQKLIDILAAARQAARFAEDLSFDEFVESELHQNAILHSLGILGEAAARLSDVTKQVHYEVPWTEVVGLRNRIVHGYFDIDLMIVFKTVKQDIPELISMLEEIVFRLNLDQDDGSEAT